MNKFLSRWLLISALGACLATAQAQSPGAVGGMDLQLGQPAAAAPQAPLLSGEQDGIAAVVGDQVITRYDLALRLRDLQKQLAQQPGGQVPPLAQLRPHVLKDMIDEYALAEFAEQTGIEVGDATLQRALKQIAANNHLQLAQLRAQVRAQGMGWKDFESQIRREVLIARLRERDVAAKVQVSPQEIDDYLRRQHAAQSGLASDSVLHLAQILSPLPDHPSAAQVAQARSLIEQAAAALQQGRRFDVVLREFTAGPDALQGGDLGQRKASQWPALFVQAVHDLQPGQVSGIIRSPAGFHILELVSRQQESALPTRAMQARVQEIVLDAGNPQARKAAVHELQGVRRAVEAGEVGFSAKAKEISQDLRSAAKGGDLGWLLPGQLPSELDAALNNLNPGEVSQPLVLPGKVVLLRLVDRREHELAPGQERAVVRNLLLQRKEAKAFAELVEQVRERTYVRIPGNDS